MGTFAIIALVLSALAAVGSGVSTYLNTKKTNESNQQQYEDWKEYNTPANQMQRLDEAGLNPYLVSNVGNTLSQPFQIGQNTGVAEALNGLSNSLASGAQFAQSHYENELNRDIQRQGLEVKKDQLKLNQLGLNIREKLARNAWRIGDARMALLYSQGRGQDILNLYNRSSLPYRLQGLYLGNELKSQLLEHNAEMFPLQEKWYEPVQRANVNKIYRLGSHYDFMESYLADKLAQEMAFNWSKEYANREYRWTNYLSNMDKFNFRYGLSRDYYELANKKFKWNNFWNFYGAFQKDRAGALDLLKFGLGKSPNSFGILTPNLKF